MLPPRFGRLFGVALLTLLSLQVPVHTESAQLDVTVIDSTGELVPVARVAIQGRDENLPVDDLGNVVIDMLEEGVYRVRAWADGYQLTDWQTVHVFEPATALQLVLAPVIYNIDDMTVTGDRTTFKWEDPALPFSSVENTREKINRVPGTFQDPFRSLHVLPGVTGVNDLSGLVRVRGGSPDQNLYLVDGLTLHNPYRMRILYGGGVSMFNLDVVENVDVHAGGFSARYGNRLSSAIEVTTREGDRRAMTYKASASLISANGVLEGPLAGGRGSWLLSARRTYYDLALGGSVEAGTTLPNFYDAQAKAVYDLDPTKQLVLEGFFGRERTDVTSDEFFSFGDETTTLGESELSLGAAIYRFRPDDDTVFEMKSSYFHDENIVRVSEAGGRIADLVTTDFGPSFRGDVVHRSGPNDYRLGMELNWAQYQIGWARDPGTSNFYFPTPDSLSLSGRRSHTGIYGEWTRRFGPDFDLSLGLRGDETGVNDARHASPRLSGTWRPGRDWIVTAAAGLFYQSPEPSLVFGRERGYDFGTSLADLSSERAVHTNVGMEWRPSPAHGVRVEGFYRDLDDLLVPRDQLNHATSDGFGFTSGFEFSVDRNPLPKRWWDGFFSYSYTHSRMRGGIHDAWTRPAGHSYHNYAASARVHPLAGWSFSTLASYTSGVAYAGLAGRIPNVLDEGVTWIPIYETRSGREWPDYFRWDLRVEHARSIKGRRVVFFGELLNVTDRRNVVGLIWNDDFTESDILQMLPRIPSVGVSVGF